MADTNVNPYAEGIEHVELTEDGLSVRILDQTLLPMQELYRNVKTPQECWDAIKTLAVRGAPCIGIFAGYAMVVMARQHLDLAPEAFTEKVRELGEYLNSSRPTAVNYETYYSVRSDDIQLKEDGLKPRGLSRNQL